MARATAGGGASATMAALIERSRDPIALACTTPDDPVIRIQRVNAALCHLFGYAEEELVGCSPDLLVGPETDLDTLRRMQESLRQRGTAADDVVFHHRDGRAVPLRASYDRMAGDDGVEWYLGVFHDRTADVEAAAALWRSEEWAQAIIRTISDVIVVTDRDTTITWAAPSVEARLGFTPEQLVGLGCWELVHPEDLALATSRWEQVLEVPDDERADSRTLLRLRHRDGSWRTMRVVASNLTDHPAVNGFVVAGADVTDQTSALDLLSEQAELLEVIARGAPLDVVLQNIAQLLERRLRGVTVAFAVMGNDGRLRVRAAPSLPREAVNRFDEVAMLPGVVERIAAAEGWETIDLDGELDVDVRDAIALAGTPQARVHILRSPGTGEPIAALALFVSAGRQHEVFAAEVVERATNLATIAIERHRFETALEHRANYDELTGIPNRSLLLQRVDASLRRAGRHDHGVAVLFIDLDRFRVVNDSVGHVLGDRLLHQVTVRLTEGLRPGDTLGRFGGDEFMVVCNRVTTDEDASAVAERILAALEEPFELGEPHGSVVLTASIGIAVSRGGHEPEELVRYADVAMYRAKDQGRNQFTVFDDTLDLRAVEKLALEQALRTAIDEEQLELHMQPVVRLDDGSITHVEALVRWQRPGHGLVMPGAFIPLAEESGLVVPMGWWVLAEAAAHAASWPTQADGTQVGVAVNLSARQLASPELVPTVASVLDQTGLEPQRLFLEVTESALVHDVARAKTALEQVKALGVRIAIDDFGTGYATLDYLRQFSMADELKIDRSFIDGVELDGSREEAIVAAAVSIARSLGVIVVAEGVETEAQADALRGLGVELAQGYLFSRPLPVPEAATLLRR